jgi:signal transduction histidine kinase
MLGPMLLGVTQAGPVYVFERPIRMLVVDDDPIMREIAEVQLAMPGGAILTADDGEAAWEILEREPPFDLVLSDLEMPRLNGFGLLQRIRTSQRYLNLPVVVITSRDDMFAVDRAYELGATSFTVKPINWRVLAYQLRYLLRGSEMEAELRAARDAAESAADLKRNLLALLQHETRTPLNAIIGYCEILKRIQPQPGCDSAQDGAAQVLDAAWRLNQTLRRVFHLSQLTAGTLPLDPEEIRVSTIVEEAVGAVRARVATAGLSLQISAGVEDPFVACDLQLLTTGVTELLTNAVTHAGAGARIEVSWSALGDDVAIEVRDDGPGLSAAMLDLCRKPFSLSGNPLTRRDGDLGIGLTTAQRVAELHGGRLELNSEEGRGTCAGLVLPALQAARRVG